MQIQKRIWVAMLTIALTVPFASTAVAQEGPLENVPPKGKTVEQVIEAFASREREFKAAREKYTWRQDVKVNSMDGDTPTGEYRIVFDVLFGRDGKRIENVVFAPQDSLRNLSMSKEDYDDIRNRLPFVLTSEEIPDYNIEYMGHQKVDELGTYVFDVAPKQIQKNRRYFEGRIWVDDQDFQIVMSRGKSVPDLRKKGEENLFPKFTTYREQIDGKYWFPTYTRADDILHFSSGDIGIRIIVKYTNYKRFGSESKIIFDGQEVESQDPNQQPNPQQQTPQGQQPPTQQPPAQQPPAQQPPATQKPNP